MLLVATFNRREARQISVRFKPYIPFTCFSTTNSRIRIQVGAKRLAALSAVSHVLGAQVSKPDIRDDVSLVLIPGLLSRLNAIASFFIGFIQVSQNCIIRGHKPLRASL